MAKEKFDVIVIGDINLDFILDVPHHPSLIDLAGSSNAVRGSNIYYGSGGAAANTAYALASLKNKVGFIGTIGDDIFKDILISHLCSVSIDLSHLIKLKGYSTGLVFRFEDNEKKSIIYASPGPNIFPLTDSDHEYLKQTKCIYISGNLLTQSKDIGKSINDAITMVKDMGIFVVLDPGRFWLNKKYSTFIDQLIPLVDLLMPNLYELQLLSGENEVDKGVNVLFSRGAKQIVIKMGENGSHFISKEKEIIVPSYHSKVDSPFGAGDVFNAGFIHGWLKGWEVEKSLHFASISSALKIQEKGTQKGIVCEEEVLRVLEQSD